MRITAIIGGAILAGIAGSALCCELPQLAIIPAKKDLAGKEAEVRTEARAYFAAMQAYTACIQADLAAAGGESAHALVKRSLILRNNAAVAEANFMMKLFTDNVGPVTPAEAPR